jgi:hypothetical protein
MKASHIADWFYPTWEFFCRRPNFHVLHWDARLPREDIFGPLCAFLTKIPKMRNNEGADFAGLT